jgi:hypothetical protein
MELYRLPGTNVQAAEIAKAIQKNWQLGCVSFEGVYNENVQILKQKGYDVQSNRDPYNLVAYTGPPTFTIKWKTGELFRELRDPDLSPRGSLPWVNEREEDLALRRSEAVPDGRDIPVNGSEAGVDELALHKVAQRQRVPSIST